MATNVGDAARRLAEARVRFSRAFLMNKISPDGLPVTDKTAEHRAIEAVGDEITVLEAELKVALMLAKGEIDAQSNS
jgi:hypothetical protein